MSLHRIRQEQLQGCAYTYPCLEALFMTRQGIGSFIHPKVQRLIDATRATPHINKPKEPNDN